MSGVPDGALALDVGVDQAAEIGCIALALFQAAVRFIAREGGGHDEGCVAEQIVLHIRFVDHLVLCAVEDLPDQLLVGAIAQELADGDLLEVDGGYIVRLPVARGKRKGEQDVFLRQGCGKRPCADIVADKGDDFAGLARSVSKMESSCV